jgi:hypothetical protein
MDLATSPSVVTLEPPGKTAEAEEKRLTTLLRFQRLRKMYDDVIVQNFILYA